MSSRPSCYVVVVAAGKSTRMGGEKNKVFLPLLGLPVICHTLSAFEQSPCVDQVTLVASPGEMREMAALCSSFTKLRWLVPGGDSRPNSVQNGLNALPPDENAVVLVCDGARPLTTPALVQACFDSVLAHGSGVAAGEVVDTIKDISSGTPKTLRRETLRAVQTPQAFWLAELRQAYGALAQSGLPFTDDASLIEHMGKAVWLVESKQNNLKITLKDDLALAQALLCPGTPITGQGYDVHRLVAGRRLVLCGVEIPFELGLDGHSDADVAIHALMDAILGAACLGDIGRLFPDTDMRYKNADSMALLAEVLRRVQPLRVIHLDITIIAQRPKLLPHMPAMLARVQQAIPGARVNIKATTTEGLGFTGRGEGIAAQAVATLC